jgi:hypothetical protein
VHPVTAGLLGAVAVAAGGLAYSAGYEVRSFRLRQLSVPVLPPGQPPLRVLQVTDLHMTPGQRRKQDWVRDLAALEPDLVIDTGDNLAHLEAVPAVLRALEPLLERPGAFVECSESAQRNLRASAWVNIDVLQRLGILPVFRRDFSNDPRPAVTDSAHIARNRNLVFAGSLVLD